MASRAGRGRPSRPSRRSLETPAYAGAFVCGRARRKDRGGPGGATGKPRRAPRAMADRRIAVEDRDPARIDWRTFETNRRILADDRAGYMARKTRAARRAKGTCRSRASPAMRNAATRCPSATRAGVSAPATACAPGRACRPARASTRRRVAAVPAEETRHEVRARRARGARCSVARPADEAEGGGRRASGRPPADRARAPPSRLGPAAARQGRSRRPARRGRTRTPMGGGRERAARGRGRPGAARRAYQSGSGTGPNASWRGGRARGEAAGALGRRRDERRQAQGPPAPPGRGGRLRARIA